MLLCAMDPRRLFWLLLATGCWCVLAAEHQTKDECLSKAKSVCGASGSWKPLCGSDGRTYSDRCEFRKAQCASRSLRMQHRGRCGQARKCLADLEYARRHRKSSGKDFQPTCRPDGSYAPMQCHQVTGMCWCVDAQGTPITNISMRRTSSGKPRCRNAKPETKRRSSTRKKTPKRGCKRADRALFNNNLIDNFHTEWSREHSAQGLSGGDLDHAVLEWKFREMDRDRDGLLDKFEYRDLKRLVKKVVKPKRCSKNFAHACDMDRDQRISRQEWADCLTRDGMDVSLRVFLSLNSDEKTNKASGSRHDPDDDDDEEEDYTDDDEEDNSQGSHEPIPSPPHGVLRSRTVLASSSQISSEDSTERREEDATDCLSDRRSVLNEHRADTMYVPECTADGRYKKIQCYSSVGYCWCVHEDTGKNIPGTSVQNSTPNCDQMSAPRPMHGCPEPKKSVFLKELTDFLRNRMLSGTNDTNITGTEAGTWKASPEEKAATWNFVVLDKNKNKVLERKEWKTFRVWVSSRRQLRRCGKRMPRYCDVNHDKKISMTEWLDCLNAKRNITEVTQQKPTTTSRRRGPNPLEAILKAD